MPKPVYDYEDGDFILNTSGNIGFDSDGDMMMRISDNMAIDLDSGEMHIVSSWATDDKDD